MLLLFTYVTLAIGLSFICSILEAVLLSVTSTYVALLKKNGKPSGKLLHKLKKDVGKPLAAILTLNTIAHTIGAAGAGAQAAIVFGSAYVGVVSAVLTLLILIFSEIIPKTLGAHYWRQLAPPSAYTLKYLVWMLYPFVKLAEVLTGRFTSEPTLSGFSREEFTAMADLSTREGKLEEEENQFLKNFLTLQKTLVKDAMTPRSVMFCLSDTLTVEEYFHKHDKAPFSRIPIYKKEADALYGYVLRSDLLLAQARGNGDKLLSNYCYDIQAILGSMSLKQALNQLVNSRGHLMLAVDEYGSVQGLITVEDVIETILGLELVDEKDTVADMQKEARRLWRRRTKNTP